MQVSQSLVECRQYAIRDQMQRAAISIPSNIAKTYYQASSRQDFIRFLRIAKGSAAELRTQCYIARKPANSPRNRNIVSLHQNRNLRNAPRPHFFLSP